MRFLWKENFRYTQDKKLIAAVGAGNIGPDTNVYTDGGLVREGVQGESLDGDFSTGRGGAGNIGKSPRVGPQSDEGRRSVDMVPEINQRNAQDEFHTGVRHSISRMQDTTNMIAARWRRKRLQGEARRPQLLTRPQGFGREGQRSAPFGQEEGT